MAYEERPYQQELIKRLSGELAKHRRVLVVAPTGSGKTVIAGKISQLLARKNKRVVFCVGRKELLKQTISTWVQFGLGEDVGIVSASNTSMTWQPFIAASIQTLYRRPNLQLPADYVFVDEAHHTPARTWQSTIDKRWPNAKIIGLTATARRADGLGLRPHFDSIVQTPQVRELIDMGYLCDFDVMKPDYSLNIKGLKAGKSGDFNQAELSRRVTGTTIVECVKSYMKYANGMQAIVFCVDIPHSTRVMWQLLGHGISAEHIDNKTPARKRDNTIDAFKRGVVQVITNVDLISEGFDAPQCQCVVMARPTASLTVYMQQAGRMMRPKPDGSKGLLLDLAGNFYIHNATPKDVVEWSLDGDINPKAKSQSERTISYHTCEVCIRAYDSTRDVCPHCGHRRERKGQTIKEIEQALIYHTDNKPNKKAAAMVADLREGKISEAEILRDIYNDFI